MRISHIIKNGGNKKTNPNNFLPTSYVVMSYTISGEGNGLNYSILRNILKDQEKFRIFWVEKPISEKVHVSFGSFGGFKNKKTMFLFLIKYLLPESTAGLCRFCPSRF